MTSQKPNVKSIEIVEPLGSRVLIRKDEDRKVTKVEIEQASDITLRLLYDPGYSLTDRAIAEQFLV